jgi:hypothetical protein
MEGEISNFERLIELAKECGFKILLAAMPRNLKRAEAELAEILALASVEAAASLAEQITSGAPGVYILAISRERCARKVSACIMMSTAIPLSCGCCATCTA